MRMGRQVQRLHLFTACAWGGLQHPVRPNHVPTGPQSGHSPPPGQLFLIIDPPPPSKRADNSWEGEGYPSEALAGRSQVGLEPYLWYQEERG